MSKKIIYTTLMSLLMTPVAYAETKTPTSAEIEQKQQVQDQRIEQGAQSGQLTEKEKAELQKKEAGIQEEKAQAYDDDGKLSAGEKKKLDRMQERQQNRIERQKVDTETK